MISLRILFDFTLFMILKQSSTQEHKTKNCNTTKNFVFECSLYETGNLAGDNVVPTSFPGMLFLTGAKDKNGKVSNEGSYLPEYRHCKDNRNDGFEYFMVYVEYYGKNFCHAERRSQ